MELVESVGQALARLTSGGRTEVRENGAWLSALEGFAYDVRPHSGAVLLHLWSDQHSQVRRVRRVVAEGPERLTLEVTRLGRARPAKLEFLATRRKPAAARITREQFRVRFRDLLAQRFPDDSLISLTTAADLEYSLSGSYVRGLLRGDANVWAVMAAAPGENPGIYDGLLTFGLIWLDRARASAQGGQVAGLRIFFPEGTGRATAHRVAALAATTTVELYEYDAQSGRARKIDPLDAGNIQSWLTQLRETETILSAAASFLERVRRYAPDAIRPHVVPGASSLEVRYRGLPFAHWQAEGVFFGIGDRQQPLSPAREAAFEKLLKDLDTYRSAIAASMNHPLYRAQPERWLESMVAADPDRVDPRLDRRFVYSQVPALAMGDRGVMDLVGVTRDGRLTVLELKAQEDIHMPLQAVDYWLRVRWHHAQQEFSRYGYFRGITLDPRPPRLLLIAPSLRFHPATDVILRHVSPHIEIERIGLSEHWRRGLKVVMRQGATSAAAGNRP
jgi:hypothetical protein